MPDAVRIEAAVDARDVELRLTLGEGELVAIVGRNGSGKSTCIQLIAGALRPDSGTISLGGTVVAGPQTFVPAHRRRIGYLEQRPLLFPHLTVAGNVAFGPAPGERRRAPRHAGPRPSWRPSALPASAPPGARTLRRAGPTRRHRPRAGHRPRDSPAG
ncbi:ATP-binding cassette domain-containing protein [Tessaracoccus sp. HDW20]|uniref:ATP-binding cassette domain-containing protein n=1 Tax=Tessaracoccus coleopterorum TaxID=2714950 RepID=UPI0018D33175|nr:ATP-binding cassette domain-containing protein [Tessaracoccus coleopterorum]NHB84203.1 ATP-binding cassette domain-containing protein [Tessaracoccus coleopterorum]